jgi:uncharacterized protein (DUF2147 family)
LNNKTIIVALNEFIPYLEMKDKPNQKKQGNQIPKSSAKKNGNKILIFAGILLAALATYMFWPSAETTMEENNVTSAPVASSPAPAAEKEKLVGRWQRTDGGYIIELKNPTTAGLIEAGYFNPNPINVGKAGWQSKDGRLMVMVELQDQNYPGSLYNLEYQPQGDKLFGTYFQAVERVSYNVEFTRIQ